jgi:hypothetical protein
MAGRAMALPIALYEGTKSTFYNSLMAKHVITHVMALAILRRDPLLGRSRLDEMRLYSSLAARVSLASPFVSARHASTVFFQIMKNPSGTFDRVSYGVSHSVSHGVSHGVEKEASDDESNESI